MLRRMNFLCLLKRQQTVAAGLSGRGLEQWPLMAKSRAGSYIGKAASTRMIRQQWQVGREAKQNLLHSPLPGAIFWGPHMSVRKAAHFLVNYLLCSFILIRSLFSNSELGYLAVPSGLPMGGKPCRWSPGPTPAGTMFTVSATRASASLSFHKSFCLREEFHQMRPSLHSLS